MIDSILEIACSPDLEDVVQAYLFLTKSNGCVVKDGVITSYFDCASDRDDAAVMLRDLPVKWRSFEQERSDWLQHYQQSLRPILIGRSFLVAPDPSLISADAGRHTLVIPQEQAFGTGSHQSTALCIELLESLELHGKTALDFGAGSGILALAMCRLGARKVTAFDHDLDAYAALRGNAHRNRCPLDIFIGSIEALRGGTFDVITMNILAEVIVPLLPVVVRHMRGSLIVSGILTDQRDEVIEAAQGLRLIDERAKEEWWAGLFATGA